MSKPCTPGRQCERAAAGLPGCPAGYCAEEFGPPVRAASYLRQSRASVRVERVVRGVNVTEGGAPLGNGSPYSAPPRVIPPDSPIWDAAGPAMLQAAPCDPSHPWRTVPAFPTYKLDHDGELAPLKFSDEVKAAERDYWRERLKDLVTPPKGTRQCILCGSEVAYNQSEECPHE